MSNIHGRFMASHSGSGLWHILDTEASARTAEILFNITPGGFTGSLGQVADLPTYTTAEVRDLIHVLTVAVDGVKLGGWENGS